VSFISVVVVVIAVILRLPGLHKTIPQLWRAGVEVGNRLRQRAAPAIVASLTRPGPTKVKPVIIIVPVLVDIRVIGSCFTATVGAALAIAALPAAVVLEAGAPQRVAEAIPARIIQRGFVLVGVAALVHLLTLLERRDRPKTANGIRRSRRGMIVVHLARGDTEFCVGRHGADVAVAGIELASSLSLGSIGFPQPIQDMSIQRHGDRGRV